MVVFQQLYTCKKNSFVGQHLVLTKILNIFICMKIFQHFFDVLLPYYKNVNLSFYYHTPSNVLHGILFQKLLRDNSFYPFKQTMT
jgi:hypothetical protein